MINSLWLLQEVGGTTTLFFLVSGSIKTSGERTLLFGDVDLKSCFMAVILFVLLGKLHVFIAFLFKSNPDCFEVNDVLY